MIILEGPDGSGKSTLAAELKKRMDGLAGREYEIIHWPGPPKSTQEILDRIEMTPTKGNYIIDRHPLFGQHVYGPLRPDQAQITSTQILEWMKRHNPVVVWCTAQGEHEVKETDSPEHLASIKEKGGTIFKRYQNLMSVTLGDRAVRYNFVQEHQRSIAPSEVITLCGSTKFPFAFAAANKVFTRAGHVVLSVGAMSHATGDEPSLADKTVLDLVHLRKIDLSEGIAVLDSNRYLEESTKREIVWARMHEKKIAYLHDWKLWDGKKDWDTYGEVGIDHIILGEAFING